ncbi:hypothetical protein LJB42_004477 [Komagataella kurtzmanii]|nr:hypothetical protein LJB42_004477 [Komagataella kurtzmanii]
MSPDLVLDPSLKVWVLLPISAVMILVGILRSYVTNLLQPLPKVSKWRDLREQQQLQKARLFRGNSHVLVSKKEFLNRQAYLYEALTSGKYLKNAVKQNKDQMPNPLSDPNASDAMFNMLKSNAANFIPQTVIMWWINYFFAGFIIMRLPFPLTLRFKSMLQQGIDTPDLDVRWVSSLSWYFVTLLGLQSVFSLILSNSNAVQVIQQQMPAQMGMPGQPDMAKVFAAEGESLQVAQFKSSTDSIEDRILDSYKL